MDGYVLNMLTPYAYAPGSAVAIAVSMTDCTPAPGPVIPANSLHVGSRLSIECEGEWNTGATNAVTMTPQIHFGTTFTSAGLVTGFTALAAASAQATTISQTGNPWRMVWRGLVTNVGTGGVTLLGMGGILWGTSLTAVSTTAIPATQAARTVTGVNNSGAIGLGISALLGTANASNTFKVNNLTAVLMN
jgi:hypothetical protein